MGLLTGKNALVFGLANDKSIAWGITQALHREGANIGISYAGEMLEKRVRPLAAQVGADFVEQCNVDSDEQITAVAEKAKAHFGEIDVLVHSIGFANKNELQGNFYDTSRAGFHLAMDISVFSFVALAKAFQPMIRRGGALLTLTYYGSVKVAPNYNMMGVAKAALESATRYLARDFGPQGIRVNAISAGPVRTLAAMGVSGFRDMHRNFVEMAPMRENITIEDCGNAAVYLCSNMSAHVTGEIHYVDSGYNIMAAPDPNSLKEQKGE
ncbi:MAG: enoyl-ACP reductase [Anaerolineae bacterium]|nr:enoyl-ACP reductase [Anaerolineae bacterium]